MNMCFAEAHPIKECRHGVTYYCPICGFEQHFEKHDKEDHRCIVCHGAGINAATGEICAVCHGEG